VRRIGALGLDAWRIERGLLPQADASASALKGARITEPGPSPEGTGTAPECNRPDLAAIS
jgi:hypothetical protein